MSSSSSYFFSSPYPQEFGNVLETLQLLNMHMEFAPHSSSTDGTVAVPTSSVFPVTSFSAPQNTSSLLQSPTPITSASPFTSVPTTPQFHSQSMLPPVRLIHQPVSQTDFTSSFQPIRRNSTNHSQPMPPTASSSTTTAATAKASEESPLPTATTRSRSQVQEETRTSTDVVQQQSQGEVLRPSESASTSTEVTGRRGTTRSSPRKRPPDGGVSCTERVVNLITYSVDVLRMGNVYCLTTNLA